MDQAHRLLPAVAAAVAGLLSAGCSADQFAEPAPEGPVVITATLPAPPAGGSRTCVDMTDTGNGYLGLLWTPGDTIGVFGQTTRNAPFRTTATANSAKASFTGALAQGDRALRAYYPYDPANDGADPSALRGRVEAVQSFDMTSGRLSGDYKYGAPVRDGSYEFSFAHIFSMLKVDIDASGTDLQGERLEYIEITATSPSGEGRTINGSFTFDVYSGEWSGLTGGSSTTRMNWTDLPELGASDSYTGFLSVVPAILAGDSIAVTVATGAHRATFAATSKVTFRSGEVYTLPLRLSDYSGKDDYGWQVKTRPAITEFKLLVADNAGRLLDNETVWSDKKPEFRSVTQHVAEIRGDSILLTVPYLWDFDLAPRVATGQGLTLRAGDTPVTSGETRLDFSRPVTLTVSDGSETRDYTVSLTNTGNPVVVIQQSSSGDFSQVKTGGFLGLGATVVNKFVDFMLRGKETDWVSDDRMTVYNPDGTVDMATAYCGVRLRGNTSQAYPKKPLAVKMVEKQAVLGMPSHKRWVLLANWLDHSMIRNSVAFDVAHAIEDAWKSGAMERGIPWNVHGRNVELVIDGHYVGNYYLCEQIKIGGKRLDIQDNYEDRLKAGEATYENCGYLLELDNNYDETYKFITSRASVPFMFKDDELSDEIFERVRAKVQGIEDNLAAGNFEEAYADLDINTVVDQWIIWELTMNHEYLDPRSVYYYMDGDSKLCAGPVWDFDRATFQNPANAQAQGSSGDRVKPYDAWIAWSASPKAGCTASNVSDSHSCVWYPYLLDDPIFRKTVRERWDVMLPYLQGVVDNIRGYGRSQARSFLYDSAMWPTDKASVQAHKSQFSDWSGDENIAGYPELIENFVSVYQARLDGMNTLITSGRWTE